MADTHINAFHGAVEEAEVAVREAKATLGSAIAALKAHPDYVDPSVPAEAPAETVTKDVPVKVKKKK